jgi:hypothetical protein
VLRRPRQRDRRRGAASLRQALSFLAYRVGDDKADRRIIVGDQRLNGAQRRCRSDLETAV